MSGSGLVLGTPAGSLTEPSSQSQGGDTLPDGEICRWPFICVTSDAALAVFGRKCTHSESCSPASPFSTPGPTSWPRSCAWEGVRARCCGPRSWLSFEMVPPPLSLSPPLPGPRGQRIPLLLCSCGSGTRCGAPCVGELDLSLDQPLPKPELSGRLSTAGLQGWAPLPHGLPAGMHPTINADKLCTVSHQLLPRCQCLWAELSFIEPLVSLAQKRERCSHRQGSRHLRAGSVCQSGGTSVKGGDDSSPPAHFGEAPLLSLINGGCFPHLWGCRVGGKH